MSNPICIQNTTGVRHFDGRKPPRAGLEMRTWVCYVIIPQPINGFSALSPARYAWRRDVVALSVTVTPHRIKYRAKCQTTFKCDHCEVYLCIRREKNCFKAWHTQSEYWKDQLLKSTQPSPKVISNLSSPHPVLLKLCSDVRPFCFYVKGYVFNKVFDVALLKLMKTLD